MYKYLLYACIYVYECVFLFIFDKAYVYVWMSVCFWVFMYERTHMCNCACV